MVGLWGDRKFPVAVRQVGRLGRRPITVTIIVAPGRTPLTLAMRLKTGRKTTRFTLTVAR